MTGFCLALTSHRDIINLKQEYFTSLIFSKYDGVRSLLLNLGLLEKKITTKSIKDNINNDSLMDAYIDPL